jgi:hypothetical protein
MVADRSSRTDPSALTSAATMRPGSMSRPTSVLAGALRKERAMDGPLIGGNADGL